MGLGKQEDNATITNNGKNSSYNSSNSDNDNHNNMLFLMNFLGVAPRALRTTLHWMEHLKQQYFLRKSYIMPRNLPAYLAPDLLLSSR